jgi:hypothetical protein
MSGKSRSTRAQTAAESTTNQRMGMTAMPSVGAASPYQPTSRHVFFPTSLNRTLLAEAFFSVNCQAHFAIVSYLSRNCICSTTFLQTVPANFILFIVI